MTSTSSSSAGNGSAFTGFAESPGVRLYSALSWSGLPLFISYVTKYEKRHTIASFAGNLPTLIERYSESTGEIREKLTAQFDGIADALVLPCGVRKTTYSGRQNLVLTRILENPACRLDRQEIDVMDVPSSTGIAAIGSHTLLSAQYTIRRYVLGDLSWQILYDRDRGCVFDDQRNLLQVSFAKRFFPIYVPHTQGAEFSPLAALLFLPLGIASRVLRRRYKFRPGESVMNIRMLHPEAELAVRTGSMEVATVDVFREVPGEYDMVLSFNLLQKNYFAAERIEKGIANLSRAVREGGLLVTGSPDVGGNGAFRVQRKYRDRLETVMEEGEFQSPA